MQRPVRAGHLSIETMEETGTSLSSGKTAGSAARSERVARARAAAEAQAIRLRGAAIAYRTARMWKREPLASGDP